MHKHYLPILALLTLFLNACTAGPQFPTSTQAQSTPMPMPPPVDFVADAQQIELLPMIEKLDRPVFVTHAGDGSGQLYIIEKSGMIRIFAEDRLVEIPFLDISERVNDGGNEQGLLGLAFAPDFAASGNFFVNYSNDDGDTVIARFQRSANPTRADPDSESIILTIEQPARNHNGGMITFGADGMLWIGMGDGGGSGDRYNNAQNSTSLLGKMLRIDVTSDPSQPYTIPADNPWVGEADASDKIRDEIWAIGLRNPWRFSFDRSSGDLWIGDVGQGQIEEINRVPTAHTGLNFGWPILEGTNCYKESECSPAGLIAPVAEYEHSGGNCSVTGGYVYRGTAFPQLTGVYFYGDYCSGQLWLLWPNAENQWTNLESLDTEMRISSFGEDEAGELYVVDYGGAVLRVTVKE